MKPSESTQIEFIKDCLRKGQQRKDILQKFTKIYKVGVKTFDTRLKAANNQMQAEIQEIGKRTEESITNEVKARKLKILTVIERQEILTQIALGKLPLKKSMVVDKCIEFIDVVPDWMDRRNAIAELNKMGGNYAPSKTDININKAGLDAIQETYE